MHYAIRPMRIEDVPQANEIDRECFPAQWPPAFKEGILSARFTHYFVAWDTREEAKPPAQSQAREQRARRRAKSRPGQFLERIRRFLSAEEAAPSTTAQRIVGIAGLWIMADEAHLTTIGVRWAYRRQGIGELLLIAAIDLAVARNARVVTLELRASNSVALALYEKYGFTKVGLRRHYYVEDGEDAVIMSTDKITAASFQSHFQRLKQAHAQRWGPPDCHLG